MKTGGITMTRAECQARWRDNNREMLRATQRDWQIRNRERISIYKKIYSNENKQRIREYHQDYKTTHQFEIFWRSVSRQFQNPKREWWI